MFNMPAWLKGNDDLWLLEIKGILSQGMILMAENGELGVLQRPQLCFVSPTKEMNNGSCVK